MVTLEIIKWPGFCPHSAFAHSLKKIQQGMSANVGVSLHGESAPRLVTLLDSGSVLCAQLKLETRLLRGVWLRC